MTSLLSRGFVMAAGLALAMSSVSVAKADDDASAMFANPSLKIYASLAKIEANLGESASKLYLRAALPATHASRAELAEGYEKDVKVIEESVERLKNAELSGEAAEHFATFKKGWSDAKALSEALLKVNSDQAASSEALLAHFKAYDGLDSAIDKALRAAATEAKS